MIAGRTSGTVTARVDEGMVLVRLTVGRTVAVSAPPSVLRWDHVEVDAAGPPAVVAVIARDGSRVPVSFPPHAPVEVPAPEPAP